MNHKFAAALAGTLAFALAACGDGSDAPAEAELPEAAVAEAASYARAGTYRSVTPQGSEVVVRLGADGNYTIAVGDEQTEAGTWEDSDTGACLTASGGFTENCFTIAPGADAGSRLITDSQGQATSYTFEGT